MPAGIDTGTMQPMCCLADAVGGRMKTARAISIIRVYLQIFIDSYDVLFCNLDPNTYFYCLLFTVFADSDRDA